MANQYLPFATGGSANTMTYSAWASLSSIIANGFQSGVASSEQFNTLMRQVSVPAAGLAQWASDTAGVNANDDGSTANFKTLIDSAVNAKLSPYLLKSGGTITGSLGLAGTGTNGFIGGLGDGASYGTCNFRLRGWYGMGMSDHNDVINGYYDFRAGKWDCKGGYFVNGVRVWDQTNFHPGNYLPLSGGTVIGNISINAALAVSSGIVNYGGYWFGEIGNDTGLSWNADNTFSAVCSAVAVAQFTPSQVTFNVVSRGITVSQVDNSTALATTAHVTNKINNLFTCSNGDIGWAKASTGQIEQWGQVYIGDHLSGGASGTFTFPVAFPIDCNLCVVSVQDVRAQANTVVTIGDPSATSVTWRMGETSSTIQNVTLHFYARGH